MRMEQHVEALRRMMLTAYEAGTDALSHKGNELYKIVERDYSKEKVKNQLVKLCMSNK